MKNQYFGDINDYRKYGLLRLLSEHGQITTAICWMLTPDDGRTYGRLINYLEEPEKWRRFDRPLYDHLRELVLGQNLRDVRELRRLRYYPLVALPPDCSRTTWKAEPSISRPSSISQETAI